jgi:hypothetical protein
LSAVINCASIAPSDVQFTWGAFQSTGAIATDRLTSAFAAVATRSVEHRLTIHIAFILLCDIVITSLFCCFVVLLVRARAFSSCRARHIALRLPAIPEHQHASETTPFEIHEERSGSWRLHHLHSVHEDVREAIDEV